MNPYFELQERCSEIEHKLNYLFKNKELLFLAFVHRSFVNENKKIVSEHNERLEFLGDGILNLLITEYLYQKFPKASEGKLSFLRSRIVDANSCGLYVQKIGIKDFVLLGKGEKQTEARGRNSILADLFEAVLGAIYLDGGIESARKFIFQHFEEEISELLLSPSPNYKAELQSLCQKKYAVPPLYKTISETGPEHAKTFVVEAIVNGEILSQGEGPSKKEAEQQAAKRALENL
jgi:ribonuclease III